MNSVVFPKRRETPGIHALPIVAYFEDDPIARGYFVAAQRFRRLSFDQAAQEHPEAERIVLASKEGLVEDHYNQFRVPNTRVLALTTQPFKDPRNHAAAYAYFPPADPDALLDRTVD